MLPSYGEARPFTLVYLWIAVFVCIRSCAPSGVLNTCLRFSCGCQYFLTVHCILGSGFHSEDDVVKYKNHWKNTRTMDFKRRAYHGNKDDLLSVLWQRRFNTKWSCVEWKAK